VLRQSWLELGQSCLALGLRLGLALTVVSAKADLWCLGRPRNK